VRQLIGRLGGGRGHRTFAGTPEQVAEYTGRTLREHYGIPRPEDQFTAADRGGLVPA
jgi:alkanesulfonate monooxygenase SsuD/methylene tetrahydromethanopterin reductase-like flavin-dependent oxidoreductase (luciferase family)